MNHNQKRNGDISSDDSESSDDSGEDLGDVATTSNQHNHQRRNVEWCGVDTEEYSRKHFSSNIKWPPDPTNPNKNRRHLRPVRPGNPLLGTKMQLYSRTNYNLAVYADGAVRGTRDDSDLHTHLELINAGQTGHVRIQGILTKLYIAMDKKGRLYGEPDMMEEKTVFIEAFRGAYSTYLTRAYAHLGWYLAIKRSGKPKRGPQTSYLQKAAHFLPRRSKFER